MSGGHFDYDQSRIFDIAESVESLIRGNDKETYIEDEFTGNYGFSDETISEFRIGLEHLKLAHAYAQRIDWLVSGDDGEDSFHQRLAEDLKLIKQDT